MALDLSVLADYAWADIARAAKAAMVNAAVGGTSFVVNGRTVGRITVEEATQLYKTATDMIALEQGGGNAGNVLVRFQQD